MAKRSRTRKTIVRKPNSLARCMVRLVRRGGKRDFVRGEVQDHQLGVVAFGQQDRPDLGMRRAVAAGQLDAADVERRRKGVGLRPGRGDDGGAGHAGGRPAGARVEDVAQLLAVIFQVLKRGRRGPQRPVAQPHLRQARCAIPRVGDAHEPASRIAVGTPSSVHAAAPAVQQHGREFPRRGQEVSHAVEGVTLADGAEVDLQPRPPKRHGAPVRDPVPPTRIPTRARAAARSASDGTRRGPRKKPHALISAPAVTSKAPSVSAEMAPPVPATETTRPPREPA